MSNTSGSKRHFLDEGKVKGKPQRKVVREEEEMESFNWREAVAQLEEEGEDERSTDNC